MPNPQPPEMVLTTSMLEYLSINGVAEHLQVSVNSVKGYRRRSIIETDRPDATLDTSTDYIVNTRLFPAPDVKVGNTYGWTQATIDAWHKARPGKGYWRHGQSEDNQ